ncbi:putative assembly protein [Bordetella ansorpii]|uniref:Putative assembly protein n=1 Tax=Bordetella ansorpii TaxID=288768 RepID=A0A157P321_9BORD|nr:AsmA family protein [Bordetella ansorpii]SAI27604.1 putative assembly protein [Bordetella ansorpii]
MKTWLKRILIGLVVVVVVAVVGLAIFLLTFDPNAYKYKLEELVQERYHRSLAIDGEIELSLFPRIGLAVQGVSLSEPNSDETFASIDSMRLAVAVWPLLSNSFVVDHVTINGFKARIVRDKQGNLNFSDLMRNDTAPASAEPTPAGAIGGAAQALVNGTPVTPSSMQIDIAGLDLQSGELQLQDAMTGMAVAVTQLNATTGRMTFNQPFDVSMSARMEGGNPRVDAGLTGQAQITLDPVGGRLAAQKLDVRMNGILPGAQAKSLAVRGNLAVNRRASSLDVSGLELVFAGDITEPSIAMTGVEASVAVPKLAADPNQSQLLLERMAVRVKGTRDGGPLEFALDAPTLNIKPDAATGQGLTGRVRTQTLDTSFGLTGISGNARELDIQQAKIDSTLKQGERVVKAAFTSPVSLNLLQRSGGLSAVKGDVNITDPGLPKGSLQIPVIGSASADLSKDQASARVNAVLEGGKFDLSTDVSQLTKIPNVKFALAVDTLDLDKLMPAAVPPKPAAPAGDGKQDASKPPAPAAPAAPPANDGSFDLSGLVGPSAVGTINIGQLVVRKVKASDVAVALELNKGKLDITSMVASLYEGKLGGTMSVDAANGNQMAAKITLADVSVQPLLADVAGRDALTGKGSIVADLKTAGANTYALVNGLGGTSQIRLRDGAIKGIDVAQVLGEAKSLFAGGIKNAPVDSDTSRQTAFTTLDADLALTKGVAKATRLDLNSPLVRVTQGDPANIDFPRSTLDFVARARVNANPSEEGKALDFLKGVSVPVHVTGPFDKPVYTLMWQSIAGDLLKQGVAQRLKDALGGQGTSVDAVNKALKGLIGK